MGGTVRGFDKVLSEANTKLRRTFGLELVQLPAAREIQLRASEMTATGLANRRKKATAMATTASSNPSFILVVSEDAQDEDAVSLFYHSDPEYLSLLLSVLVTVTLSSESPMNHGDLCRWIAKAMRVKDEEADAVQPVLGETISDWLDTLYKQRYLHRERISLVEDEVHDASQQPKLTHPWAYGIGPRGELEFPTEAMKVFCQKLASQGDQDADQVEDLHRRIDVTFSRFSKQKATIE